MMRESAPQANVAVKRTSSPSVRSSSTNSRHAYETTSLVVLSLAGTTPCGRETASAQGKGKEGKRQSQCDGGAGEAHGGAAGRTSSW